MSIGFNLQNNEFTTVSYKRKGKIQNRTKKELSTTSVSTEEFSAPFDLNLHIRRITEATDELSATDLFQSVSALLREGSTHIGSPKISKIICFGLGRISELTVPRYQLALLLCLKDLLSVDVLASDPIFNCNDLELLKHFNINIEKINLEAKYNVKNQTILFYLPHCPKQLTNNLLWSNWGLNLSKCIIIANSINKIVEDNYKIRLLKIADYVSKICPYVLELGVVNSFKLFQVFNDTSVHFFPVDKLNLLSEDFWEDHQEPEYSDSDVEFIRKSVDNELL